MDSEFGVNRICIRSYASGGGFRGIGLGLGD